MSRPISATTGDFHSSGRRLLCCNLHLELRYADIFINSDLAIPARSFVEAREGCMHKQLRARIVRVRIVRVRSVLSALGALALLSSSASLVAQTIQAETDTANLVSLPDAPTPAVPASPLQAD